MKKLIFAFLIFLSGFSFFLTDVKAKLPAEEKLIQKIKEVLTPTTSAPKGYPVDFHPICATPAFVWLPAHRGELSPEAQKELSLLMPDRPTYTTTKITYDTPGGYFRIHYVTSTSDSVYKSSVDTLPADGHPDYVNFVGAVMDSMWMKEVDTLGYYSPPNDSWYSDNGGNAKYDVYLKSMAFGYLGYAQPERYAPPDYIGATSYIVLRNDYSVYGGNYNNYLRVTSAHEFFHAIQFAYDVDEYEYDPSDPITPVRPYWMEISATWMTDVAYDNINYYLSYLRFFYNYPWFSLKTFSDTLINNTPADTARYFHAYASCVWAFYLSEKFGADVIKNIWILCTDIQGDNVLSATDDVLLTKGSSFDQAFSEFSVWNYFTNYRADITNYYSEGNLYPLVKVASSQYHISYPVNMSSAPYPPEVLGTNYVRFDTQPIAGGLNINFNGVDSADWITSIIGYSSADPDTFAEFTLDSLKSGNFKFHNWNDYDDIIMIPAVITKTTGSFNYSYSATYDSTLTDVEEIPDLLPHSFTLSQNYPNPFNPSTTIPFQVYGSQFIVHGPIHTTFKIYNILGDLVRTLMDEKKMPGNYQVVWDGRDDKGEKVSSGIYFYRLEAGGYSETKRMILVK